MHDGLLYHYSLGSANLSILIYNGISMSVNYYKARLNPHLPVPLQFPTPSSSPCLPFHLSAFMGLPSHWYIHWAPNSFREEILALFIWHCWELNILKGKWGQRVSLFLSFFYSSLCPLGVRFSFSAICLNAIWIALKKYFFGIKVMTSFCPLQLLFLPPTLLMYPLAFSQIHDLYFLNCCSICS